MMRTTYRASVWVTLALLGGAAQAGGGGWSGSGDPEVIVEWNELVERAVPAGGLAPPRHYAMVHIAMFDAVNSIERRYRPYRLQVHASRAACPEVAAAQAAHDVLVAQFPAQQAIFDAALSARIASANPWQVRPAVQVGKAVAAAILAWRAGDGWTVPPEPYALPPLPGMYQPTPPSFAAPAFRQMATTTPFGLLTSTQYLPAPPPVLTSERYAQDLEEVKALGAETSSARTPEQTQLALLFASVTSRTVHWALWNHVARDLVRAKQLTLLDAARAFAFVNVAIHDGLQTSHTSKFIYGGWRPITAIQRADEDMNPLTTADPTWKPLLTTPPYPSHAGNMACVSASAARMLSLINGSDAFDFTAVWIGSSGQPDIARKYGGFAQLAEDQANSRIYGGIHFRFESMASQQACPQVAEYIYANRMRPRRY